MNWSLPGNIDPGLSPFSSAMLPAVNTRPSLATLIVKGGGRAAGVRRPLTLLVMLSIRIWIMATPSAFTDRTLHETISVAETLNGTCSLPATTEPLNDMPSWYRNV